MNAGYRAHGLKAFGILLAMVPSSCGQPTGVGRVESEVVVDLSALLGTASARQALLSIVASAELDVDGQSQAPVGVTGEEPQASFPVQLDVGEHDFEARVLSNTGAVLYMGRNDGFPVTDDGFQVPIQMSPVSGVLFVTPGEIGVGGSTVGTIGLENRGSRDLRVTVGPLTPPATSCGDETACLFLFGFEGPVLVRAGATREIAVHAGSGDQASFSLRLTATDEQDAAPLGFVDLPLTVLSPGLGTIDVLFTIDGSPVPGTTVNLTGSQAFSSSTDASGRARFTDVPLGPWTITVPQFGVQRTATLFYGGHVASVFINIVGLHASGRAGPVPAGVGAASAAGTR